MSAKSDLKHSILTVLKHNRDGGYTTQADRQHVLLGMADGLAAHFKLKDIHGLKQKHIYFLLEDWQKNALATGTIKNRLANIRWLCEKLNKRNVVPDNKTLGIGQRRYSTNQDKSTLARQADLSKITNPYLQVSLQLQRVFGLRREECLKIKPFVADRGKKLSLQASWCKGGRARDIPIRTEEQRHWLNEAKKMAKQVGHSLIPPDKTYIVHRRLYDRQAERAGLCKLHGFRHAYAQDRYRELTGWAAPAAGGRTSHQLTVEEREIDHAARLLISAELGHVRESITAVYLGR